jgi:hypothetical protein
MASCTMASARAAMVTGITVFCTACSMARFHSTTVLGVDQVAWAGPAAASVAPTAADWARKARRCMQEGSRV